MFTNILNSMVVMSAQPAAPSGDFSIGALLTNSTHTLQGWGGSFIILIGVVMIISAVWHIAKGLMDQGRGQTNWFMVVLLLIVGGAFTWGGFNFVSGLASGGKKTIEDLGKGTAQSIVYTMEAPTSSVMIK